MDFLLGATETDTAVPLRRIDSDASGDPRIARSSPPRAPAKNFKFTIRRSLGVTVGRVLVIPIAIPVSRPFPYVPCHIVLPVTVGRVSAHRSRCGISIVKFIVFQKFATIPVTKVRLVRFKAVAPWENGVFSALCRLLPLRFRRQAFSQPLAIVLRLAPGHFFHWTVRSPVL